MKKNIGALLLFFCFAVPLHAEKTEELLKMKTEDLFALPLEELLDREISSAGKMTEKISDIPASVHIVTRDDIEKFGYRTVAEVIRNIPGFYTIYNYNEDIAGVRGILSQNNMIILVNGVVQHMSWLNAIMMPADAVDRIEVVRGPMSVIYGSGAFLGSINIVTNEIPYEAPLNMVSGSYGSADTYKTFARASGEKKDFRYVLNASLYGTDGVEESYQDMMSSQQYERLSPSAHKHTHGDLERENANLNFSAAYKGTYADFQYNETENGIFSGTPSFDRGSEKRTRISTGRIGYQHDLTEKFTLDGKVTYSYADMYEKDAVYPPEFYESGAAFTYEGKEERVEGELDLVWKPDFCFSMIFGLSYKKIFGTSYDGVFPVPTDEWLHSDQPEKGSYSIEDRDTYATFSQINWRPFDCLKITAGARLEQYKKFDTDVWLKYTENTSDSGQPPPEPFMKKNSDTGQTVISGHREILRHTEYNGEEKIYFIPRIAAVYSLSDHHIFKLMYGKANKPFTAEEADLTDIERGLETDLYPQEIETAEINYLLSYADFSFSLSLFRNDIQNLRAISLQETENAEGETLFIPLLDNSGRMETYGSEMILTFRPAAYLNMELSAAYQDTENRTSRNRLIAYSPHLLMKAKVSYRRSGFTASLSGQYVDETEPERTEIQSDNNYERIFAKAADDYFVADLNLRYDHEKTGLFTALKISNVFDKEVRYPSEYLANGLLDEGRSFLFTAGWKF